MPLDIDVKNPSPETLRVVLAGSLDSQTAPRLDHALDAAYQPECRLLAFDMGSLEFISSAGLRVIFKNVKRIKKSGGRVGVSRMNAGVRKVFEIVQAIPDLDIFASVEEMDEYLATIQRRALDDDWE
ncbi:anti-anti-sigma factor [Pseudomonas pohangensis]|uniref:Anti-sigma factor antagonist n=1 Tax=Pseudomonas pohangensis TaxID=364197 RepID=A0A1H2EXA7_9PSED|nr:STAS domain-containing protein [Pseudomonas pohangensis]SDT99715.1 anti-anti-sigma factor [Pseudomonas pohangensis]